MHPQCMQAQFNVSALISNGCSDFWFWYFKQADGGVRVSSLIVGGPAEESAKIKVGDVVVTVNGESMSDRDNWGVCETIKAAARPVTVHFERPTRTGDDGDGDGDGDDDGFDRGCDNADRFPNRRLVASICPEGMEGCTILELLPALKLPASFTSADALATITFAVFVQHDFEQATTMDDENAGGKLAWFVAEWRDAGLDEDFDKEAWIERCEPIRAQYSLSVEVYKGANL